MNQLIVSVDPSRMENPDLDMRYDLFDFLDELFPDMLQDGGYDYAGTQPLLLIFIEISKESPRLQLDSLLEAIQSYQRFGADFKNAIQVFIDSVDSDPVNSYPDS
ncbi:hypothetical protein Pan153_09760 [Gimesia panareensis]|uniref:Barstar (Barnase inhibitor) n=1 Tax=Gimesia panareensis TaxID=2527978 RepID=A0A518FJ21_9PLAN|nr:hypothetical protein [Gimesia panareensis]QDV16349.1 hypothetical protein Pan153_09760 [Gimesia panareensis]